MELTIQICAEKIAALVAEADGQKQNQAVLKSIGELESADDDTKKCG